MHFRTLQAFPMYGQLMKGEMTTHYPPKMMMTKASHQYLNQMMPNIITHGILLLTIRIMMMMLATSLLQQVDMRWQDLCSTHASSKFFIPI